MWLTRRAADARRGSRAADGSRTRAADGAGARAAAAPSRAGWWVAAAALAAAAVLAVIVLRTRAPEPALLHVALPTGDALTGTAGAQFEIAELTPASRRVRLDAGAMVFDVAHVVAGQRFEVAAGDVTVIATGTVFSVAADPRGAHVHVYEGSVEVHRGAQSDRLAAGGEWSAAPGVAADPPALIEAGHAAAQARAVHVASVAAVRAAARAPRDHRPVPVARSSFGFPRPRPQPLPFPRPFPLPPPNPLPLPAPVPAAAAASRSRCRFRSRCRCGRRSRARSRSRVRRSIAARADITAGRYTAALTKVAAAPRPLTGAWLLVDADGLRALGKKRDAADALATAAPLLDGTAQLEAAYSAAYLRFHDLHDAAGALAVLTAADVDIPGSLFEERGLALHVQILVAGGKRGEARPLAQRYLERFSLGELRPLMLSIVRQDASK